jgi:hypothetical protein
MKRNIFYIKTLLDIKSHEKRKEYIIYFLRQSRKLPTDLSYFRIDLLEDVLNYWFKELIPFYETVLLLS